MFDIKKILVPIDFAESSKKGLETALKLAEKYKSRVTVLHTWIMPEYVSPSIAASLSSGRNAALEAYANREAEDQLSEFMEKIEKPDGVPIAIKVAYGIPHEVILEHAKDHDLVVMGTHGRRGLAHLVLGSVTEKVMRLCDKPVLVVNASRGNL